MIKVNLNNRIRVKVNEPGRKLLDDYWLNGERGLSHAYKIDDDGYIEMLLWQAMHIFGPEMFMGQTKNPIEMTVYIEPSKDQGIMYSN